MTKKIFIYYSLTGNGDEVASCLKSKGYDIRKIITKEPLPNNYIFRILAGGYKAMINYEDKLLDFNQDISEYDEVIVGSPIWNSRLSSPINTVLNILDLKNKNITFILYSGSGKSPKATERLKKEYPNSKIIDLKEPRINKEELKKFNLKDIYNI